MRMGRGWALAALLSAAAFVGSDQAEAAVCSTTSVTTSTHCTQANPLGNGSNTTLTEMNGQSIFGKKTWQDLGKINTPDGNAAGSLAEDNFSITFSADRRTGTWALTDGFTFDSAKHYALALKGAPSSIVYLLNTAFSSGTWSMADIRNNGGQVAGLSNITLFGTGPLVPVPLPAAAWLLLSGLGALFVAGRRRKAATA